MNGAPDRLVLLPDEDGFCRSKAPVEGASPTTTYKTFDDARLHRLRFGQTRRYRRF